MVSRIIRKRRQASRRVSSEATKSLNSIGLYLVQKPPGERKSGMPHSVDTPAPVKITARLDALDHEGQFFYVSLKQKVTP